MRAQASARSTRGVRRTDACTASNREGETTMSHEARSRNETHVRRAHPIALALCAPLICGCTSHAPDGAGRTELAATTTAAESTGDDRAASIESGAQWWQWELSIPTAPNPTLDTTGTFCMVGQRGKTWYLAGSFGNTPVTRKCTLPAGVEVFFPVVNNIFIDTPNLCGQGPAPTPVADMRAQAALVADSVTSLSVELDGQTVHDVHRLRSPIFPITLPADNFLFCNASPLPATVFRAVDDGFYAETHALREGSHTLHFVANAGSAVLQDITYQLTAVQPPH
jgi:hypothetical protein